MSETGFIICTPRPARSAPEGRFEYRVWPRQPHPAVPILQSSWPLAAAERRSDIYLLHPESDLSLVKLRDGRRLEIKHREEGVGSVQYWSLPVSTGFPWTARARAELARALGLRRSLPPDAGRSPAHLLAALDHGTDPVGAQTVRKSRLLFSSGACRAEVCRVQIADWTGVTVALEAEDLRPLGRAVERLHLATLPNRSYGAVLRRLDGSRVRHRPLPRAEYTSERRIT